MTDAQELKPCPFCGGTDIRWQSHAGISWCRCRRCHADGPPAFWTNVPQGDTAKVTLSLRGRAAQDKWNQRPALAEATRAIDPASVKGDRE